MSPFSIAKATHFFCRKNINVFVNTLSTTVNVFVIKELVKLIIFGTMDPDLFIDSSIMPIFVSNIILLRPISDSMPVFLLAIVSYLPLYQCIILTACHC